MNDLHNNKAYKVELLDLLRRVDHALTANNIEYFAVYGTCLGAAREHGIIPWDDDVDIAVRRCDFQHALQVLNVSQEQIYAGDRTNIPGCPNRCGRIFNRIDESSGLEKRRAYIDLHVIDYAPVSTLRFLWNVFWYVGAVRILEKRLGKMNTNHKVLYGLADIAAIPLRLLSSSTLQRLADWLYISKKTSRLVKLTFDGNRKRYPAASFSDVERFPFSGLSLPIPIGYDEFLTICYGDWRTRPPTEERYSHAYDRTGVHWTVQYPDDDNRQYLR